MEILKLKENVEILYEPVWRITWRNEKWKFKRLWCVFDQDNRIVCYGKKKKYAIQKYEKAIKRSDT